MSLFKKEPVVIAALILIVLMAVQKIWLGEPLTIEWVQNVLTLAAGAGVLRSLVSPAGPKGKHIDETNEG